MTGGIQTAGLREGICQAEPSPVPTSKAWAVPISGRGVWWVPWVPGGEAARASGRARGWGPPQTASQALDASTPGDKRGWPWGCSATRSWRARPLRATIVLIPTPRPANANQVLGCTEAQNREGSPAWGAGLAKRKGAGGGALGRVGPSQNTQEGIPTLVYNALLGKLANE